jgi:hypothetical protein
MQECATVPNEIRGKPALEILRLARAVPAKQGKTSRKIGLLVT